MKFMTALWRVKRYQTQFLSTATSHTVMGNKNKIFGAEADQLRNYSKKGLVPRVPVMNLLLCLKHFSSGLCVPALLSQKICVCSWTHTRDVNKIAHVALCIRPPSISRTEGLRENWMHIRRRRWPDFVTGSFELVISPYHPFLSIILSYFQRLSA